MLPFGRILVATDFSPESLSAFPVARRVAQGAGATVFLVHVLPAEPETPWEMPPYVDFGLSVLPAKEYLVQLKEEVLHRLELLAKEYFAGGQPWRPILRVGDPAHEIVRASVEESADLIVVATHGWTGWRKFVFGSIAERVLRDSACPVLVVKCAARGAEPPLAPSPDHGPRGT